MLDLIVKDVVLTRWFLAILVPIYVAQLVGLSWTPPAFLLVTLLFTAIIAIGPLVVDEIQGTEILWCSLPLSRQDVVFARYGSTLLGIAGGLALSWIIARFVIGALAPGAPTAELLGPAAYAAFFLVLTLLAALFLPCYFLFGAGKGLLAFAGLCLCLLVALTLGAAAVSAYLGDGLSPSEWPRPDPEVVAAWSGRLSATIPVLLVVVALVASAASAVLAAGFYRRRDC